MEVHFEPLGQCCFCPGHKEQVQWQEDNVFHLAHVEFELLEGDIQWNI